jgi:hypothetical protein
LERAHWRGAARGDRLKRRAGVRRSSGQGRPRGLAHAAFAGETIMYFWIFTMSFIAAGGLAMALI